MNVRTEYMAMDKFVFSFYVSKRVYMCLMCNSRAELRSLSMGDVRVDTRQSSSLTTKPNSNLPVPCGTTTNSHCTGCYNRDDS